MSKFQEEYSLAPPSFEDFILVMINDLYNKVAPNKVKCHRNINNPKMCERSQFNRTRRNLAQVTNLIFTEFAKQFADNIFIVDSFPLEEYKFGRAHFCKTFQDCAQLTLRIHPKKQTYFGFKVHVITTYQGAIKAFEITPANIDDLKGLEDLSLVVKADSVILGDKGYISQPLEQELRRKGKILLTLKRSNQIYSSSFQKEIFKRRRSIETTFSQLSGQLNAQRGA